MIRFFLYCYILLLMIDFVVSMFPKLRNESWAKNINSLTEPVCVPFRKMLPKELPIDFSHFLVVGIILLIMKLW